MADDMMRDILQRYIDDGRAKNLKEAEKLFDEEIQESMNKESTRVKIEKEKKASGGLVGGQTKLDKNKDGKISGVDFKMMNKGGMIKKYAYGGRVAKSSAEKS